MRSNRVEAAAALFAAAVFVACVIAALWFVVDAAVGAVD